MCTPRNAGTSKKPDYIANPLTHEEPILQHQKGQSVIGPRDWWQAQAEKHLRRWIAP